MSDMRRRLVLSLLLRGGAAAAWPARGARAADQTERYGAWVY